MSIIKRTTLSIVSISSAVLLLSSFNVNALGQADRQNEVENFGKSNAYVHIQ